MVAKSQLEVYVINTEKAVWWLWRWWEMNFSQKLQSIRKNKGFTQEELAGKLDVSRQAVAKWEAGD